MVDKLRHLCLYNLVQNRLVRPDDACIFKQIAVEVNK